MVWLTAVGAGYASLWRYTYAPGVAADAPTRWPIASKIPRQPDDPVLVMVLHPQCPCSRASIGELAVLMAHASRSLQAFVVFEEPAGFAPNWAHTDLWSSAGRIPGVIRVLDWGREAQAFGAATSGQTLLYDERGQLLFSGGITAARGHYGDNAGLRAIASILRLRRIDGASSKSAVYGCPLFAARSSKSDRGEDSKCHL